MFKKIVSVLMAASMMLSVVALTASAAESEESVAAEGSSEVAADASSEVGAAKEIYFDVSSSGWGNVGTVYCHIWAADGVTKPSSGEDWPSWQSKKEKCKFDKATGIATYDLSKTGHEFRESDGNKYCVIFSVNTGMQTYNTIMSGGCIGDTVYCTGKTIENPEDSEKTATEAAWKKNPNCGPEKKITSTGNIVGTAYPEGCNDTTLLAQYLIQYYNDPAKLELTQQLLNTLKVSPTDVMVVCKDRLGDDPEKKLPEIEKVLVACTDPTTEEKPTTPDIQDPTINEKEYTWEIDKNGTLYIWGNTVINEDGYSIESDIPWYSERDSIKDIVINEGITGIGNYAFMNHSNVISITIPDSVKCIGELAFFDVTQLESITVSENNNVYSSIDGVLFNKEQTEIIKCPNGKSGKYIVPDTVINIGTFSFRECRKLTDITISDNVESIGYGAFLDNTSLLCMKVPENVTNIEDVALGYMFYKGGNKTIDDFKIIGYSNTAAENYAIKNGFKFIDVNSLMTYEDKFTGISVTLSKDAKLSVEKLTGTSTAESVFTLIDKKENLVDLFEISLTKGSESIQLDEPAMVKIPSDNETAKVYRVELDNILTDMKAVYEDGYLKFYTEHFSKYVVTSPKDYVCGDINGDGVINAKDRMMLTRYLAKWSGYESVDMTSADVNNDGDVNAKDRMILTRYLAKWQGYETLPFDKNL